MTREPDAIAWSVIGLAFSFCIVLVSSSLDISQSRSNLADLANQQSAELLALHKADTQLNALSRGVKSLADGGDANAQAIIATLEKNGVRVTSEGAEPAP